MTLKKIVLVLLSVLFAGSAFAGPKVSRSSHSLLKAYLSIQNSLANDSMKGVHSAALRLVRSTHDRSLISPAKAISHDKTIKATRSDFKMLSIAMKKTAKTAHFAGIEQVYCPMAKASWLQRRGKTMNPYLGKKMQGCGEVVQ